jgi:hypothetical protein
MDQINDEVRSISYFATEAWRDGGNSVADEHAFLVAPILRRIRDLSEELAGMMAGLQIDAEFDEKALG